MSEDLGGAGSALRICSSWQRMEIERFNRLEWIFEKIFDQLGQSGCTLRTWPWNRLQESVFHSENICGTIGKLINRPVTYVEAYLSQENFLRRFLFTRLKRRIPVAILIGNIPELEELLQRRTLEQEDYHLMALNGHKEMIDWAWNKTGTVPSSETLYYCSCHERRDLYFHLRQKGVQPNLSIYAASVESGCLEIVKDVSSVIGLTPKILKLAFEAKQTCVIPYLIQVAQDEKVPLAAALLSYPILVSNKEIIDLLLPFHRNRIDASFFHTAVLSGDLEMVHLIESYHPKLHQGLTMDIPRENRGQKNLLLHEIIYQKNGRKYFSHTINYAVQSGSIAMVDYLVELGYGISSSNILTAVRQADIPMLRRLIELAPLLRLPYYYWLYFGFGSIVTDKYEKALLLVESGHLSLESKKPDSTTLRIIGAHLDILSRQTIDDQIEKYSIEYLLNYQAFFSSYSPLSQLDLAVVVYQIQNNLSPRWVSDQMISDVVTLIGSKLQMFLLVVPPRDIILGEILCYDSVFKICYLHQKDLLNTEAAGKVVATMGDPSWSILFERLGIQVLDDHLALYSGKCIPELIDYDSWKIALDHCPSESLPVPPKDLLPRLINYARSRDMIEEAEIMLQRLEDTKNQ